MKKIFGSVAVLSLLFVGAWVTVDFSDAILNNGFNTAEAVIDCHSCIHYDGGGGGWVDFGGGFGGFGGGGEIGGGGGGFTPTPNAPTCTLNLSKDTISWTTTEATNVDIVPLTNSPDVPGAHVTPNPAPGTVVVNLDFGALVAQYKTQLQQDIGAYVIDGFYANKTTADRICSVIAPGTVSGTYGTDNYSSPKNNTVLIWNGSSWSQYNAKNYNSHFRYNFTCIVGGAGQSKYDLSGSTNFVPPLGVGTHTYKLTATGSGGSKACQATVVVPPPPAPGCIEVLKETYDTQGNVLTPVAQFTFKLDNGPTITTDATGYGKFTNVTLGTHTVTEVNPGSSWQLISVTPANGTVNVANANACFAVVFKNKQVLPPPGEPSCTLTATNTTVGYNDPANLKWTTTNATSFTINQGVGSVTPVAAGSATTSALTTTKTFTGTATSAGGKTATCKVTITVPPPPGPGCIEIKKETFNTLGNPITPVAQFTFKLDNGPTVQNDSTGYAKFENVSVGNHKVEELNPGSAWELISVTPSNGMVNVPSGNACAALVFKNKQKPLTTNPPACTLSVDPTSVTSGNASTLTWTTSNAVSFTIDHNIGSVTPVSGGATTTGALTTTTLFTGTAKNAAGDTVTCTAEIGVLPAPGPSCTLSLSKSKIDPGEAISVSWTSGNVTSGTIDHNVGTANPVAAGTINDVYPSDDTVYTGTFTGPYGTATCSATVTIQHSGCSGSCGGGGLEQPNVQLSKIQNPGEQPFAFVSLSQIPYTGFEAGALLTALFWTAIALWSLGITYVLMGRGSIRFVTNHLLAFAPITAARRQEEDTYQDPLDEYETTAPVATYVEESVVAPAPVMPITPVAPAPAVDSLPSLTDVIESRAHAAGVLLSPEATVIAASLSNDRAETLRVFGGILNEAVRTVPREDGWILLSADRMRQLAQEVAANTPVMTETPVTPAIHPVLDDTAVSRFVSALLSGDRDTAFSILNALESESASPSRFATGVASTLDKLYRARKNGAAFDDVALKEKAALIPETGLQSLVEVFVHALDSAYASKYTGLKIALAQAFDIRTT